MCTHHRYLGNANGRFHPKHKAALEAMQQEIEDYFTSEEKHDDGKNSLR